VYNSVQIPALRKNVTGNASSGNQYLSLPDDYLSAYSVAVIDTSGNYNYLLNKDVNFLRESYPAATLVSGAYQGTPGGVPKYYALFGSQYSNANELSLIMAPTPDSNYPVEMHYFYYPVSIVQGQIATFYNPVGGSLYTNGNYQDIPLTGGNGSDATATITVAGGAVTSVVLNNGGSFYIVGDVLSATTSNLGGTGSGFTITVATTNNPNGTSWLGDNFDPVLLYGSMREAVIFMKGEQDMVAYYEKAYQEGMGQLKRLGDGLERNDAYRKGQTSLPYNQL
ncbi:MAG: hypothetical protein WCK03_03685, partial [Candidatus Taylorbacteria bacterium]